jgi:opine dehydrogenase
MVRTVSGAVVAVIGAGNVGCALAADLSLRGAEVRLCARSTQRLDAIKNAGGITAQGAVAGTAPVAGLTTHPADAIRGADVVAVTVPTPALPDLVAQLTDAVTPDQVLWLDPGHSGGSLYLAAGRSLDGAPPMCQLSTASHVSRMAGPTTVQVFALPRAALAALPATRLDECLGRIDALLPGQFVEAPTVLDLDLTNINAVGHPAPVVCNAGWIEATAGDFRFYSEGISPSVARVLEAIDTERRAVATRFGVPDTPLVELLVSGGFTTAEAARDGSVHAALQGSAVVREIKSPPGLDHRYLHEDVGWGLVPWIELGAAAGVDCPTMAAVTELAGALNGVDYRSTGLTLHGMGLAGLSPAGVRSYVETGQRDS